MYKYSVLLHILAACIWTGGHLVLAFSILPPILRTKDIPALMAFESKFEKIGIPSLITLVVTGIYQALTQLPFVEWFNFSDHISRHISFKILLLIGIVILAMHARLKLIPQGEKVVLKFLAAHIYLVTLLSVLLVVVGLSFRMSII